MVLAMESRSLAPIVPQKRDVLIIPETRFSQAEELGIERLLFALDSYIEHSGNDVAQSTFQRVIHGISDDHQILVQKKIKALTVDDFLKDKLNRIKTLSPNPFISQWASTINRWLYTPQVSELAIPFTNAKHNWRMIRASLGNDSLKGAYALEKVIATNPDSYKREQYYQALFAQDTSLAAHMIQMRNTGNEFFKEEECNNQLESSLKFGYGLSVSEFMKFIKDTNRRVYPVFLTAYKEVRNLAGSDETNAADNLYYWAEWRRRLGKKLIDVSPEQLIHQIREVTRQLGLIHYFSEIYIDDKGRPGKELARAFSINPPYEVAVSLNPLINFNLNDISTWFHEIGHGLHFKGVDPRLPYVFRKEETNPWSEGMAMVFEGLMTEPGVLTSDEDKLYDLNRAKLLSIARSTVLHLLKLDFESMFYQTQSNDIHEIGKEATTIFTKYNPGVTTFNPYWWANDMYLGGYPTYSLNYIQGFMIAAQLKAYGRKNFGKLLSPEFGNLLMKCYKPGSSKPWREILKDITREDLNPEYFYAEMEEAIKISEKMV